MRLFCQDKVSTLCHRAMDQDRLLGTRKDATASDETPQRRATMTQKDARRSVTTKANALTCGFSFFNILGTTNRSGITVSGPIDRATDILRPTPRLIIAAAI